MTDLENRLRDALHGRAQTTTISLRMDHQQLRTPTRSRRPLLVATCVGAATVTIGGLVALSNRGLEPNSNATNINAPIVTSTTVTSTSDATSVPAASSTSSVEGRNWRTLATPPLSARDDAAVVWTGSEVLVWGGGTYNSAPSADGARYDPVTDSWTTMPAAPLSARHDPIAAWTGTELLVWGGINGAPIADGAAYNPTTNTWRPIAAAPLEGVSATLASTAWTGTELIIWGGDNAAGSANRERCGVQPGNRHMEDLGH